MQRGQATLELLLGYSIALIIIAIALALVFMFYPGVVSAGPSSTYSGFSGLRIVQQGYYSPGTLYFIKFQNLLNENININAVYFLASGLNKTGVCTAIYVPALGYEECNVSLRLSSPYSANIQIVYSPANTSIKPNIQIVGSVSGSFS
jgi:hypothetical protein